MTSPSKSPAALHRRELLALLGGAGLVALLPRSGHAKAPAAVGSYAGPFLVTVHAGGGWDPTSLCDPKGRVDEKAEKPVNKYLKSQIVQQGPFALAPTPGVPEFFAKHQARLIVVNGLDTSTNGHDSGTRHVWSGGLVEGYPSLAALFAAQQAPSQPLAFLTSGGYDHTADLVSRTRVGSVAALTKLTVPNRMDPKATDKLYHSEGTWQKISAMVAQRGAVNAQNATLPAHQAAMLRLQEARLGVGVLDLLTSKLPAKLDASGNPLKPQAEIAAASFAAGLTASASLELGGFDTHGNHDATHLPRLKLLLEGVDHLWSQLETQGVADKTIVVVSSDFGRTPSYNEGNGKDHWSITAALVLGPTVGPYKIDGGRVVGATTDGYAPREVDPKTLQVVDKGKGVRIQPGHLHLALRQHLGIAASEAAKRFAIKGQLLPLLVKA